MKKDKINELKKEIRKLKRENAFLRQESQRTKEYETLTQEKSFFSYLVKLFKSHSSYKCFSILKYYFLKFRIFSTVFKALSFIVIAIETSAVLLILAAVLALTLPPIILLYGAFFAFSAIGFSKDRRRTLENIKGKKVIVLFPKKQFSFTHGSFFYRNALDLISKGYSVMAVSPFIISSKGLSGDGKFYFNRYRDENGVTLIRQQYFFHIQKRLLRNHPYEVIFVY